MRSEARLRRDTLYGLARPERCTFVHLADSAARQSVRSADIVRCAMQCALPVIPEAEAEGRGYPGPRRAKLPRSRIGALCALARTAPSGMTGHVSISASFL